MPNGFGIALFECKLWTREDDIRSKEGAASCFWSTYPVFTCRIEFHVKNWAISKKNIPQSDEPFKSYAIFALQSFRKIHKVKNSRKSGVKSSFCKGHFHANWAIAKSFQNFENIFLMCGSNLLWYIPPSRHFTKTRYCRVKSLYTGHFTLKFRVKYATCHEAKMWIPLPPRVGCVWQQIWTTH